MILRFAALHGLPTSDEEWEGYRTWRKQQEALPECRMMEVEGEPDGTVCKDCPGHPDCPKERRRA